MTEASPREGTVAARRARVDGRPLSSTPSARRAFKWLDARSLWKSRNDLLARFLHTFFSEIFDVDTPPMYKQFLRLDADAGTLRITCHAAIGDTPPRPYVEEVFDVDLREARAAV